MTENPTPVRVVCALIERDGQVLLARRPNHKHLGDKWEFPGGKVERGESPHAAIVREIREELGCTIVIERELPSNLHVYERGPIEMIPFVARLDPANAMPVPHEHSALAWVQPADFHHYDLAPADHPVVAAYRQSS